MLQPTWVWARVRNSRILEERFDVASDPFRKFRVIGQGPGYLTILVEDEALNGWDITPSQCEVSEISSVWVGKRGWHLDFGCYLPVKEARCHLCR